MNKANMPEGCVVLWIFGHALASLFTKKSVKIKQNGA